jgi:hypothetical protein
MAKWRRGGGRRYASNALNPYYSPVGGMIQSAQAEAEPATPEPAQQEEGACIEQGQGPVAPAHDETDA